MAGDEAPAGAKAPAAATIAAASWPDSSDGTLALTQGMTTLVLTHQGQTSLTSQSILTSQSKTGASNKNCVKLPGELYS